MVTLGSHGCDRGIECVDVCTDDVLPESECETMRTSRQFEYVLKCGTNLQPKRDRLTKLQITSIERRCTLVSISIYQYRSVHRLHSVETMVLKMHQHQWVNNNWTNLDNSLVPNVTHSSPLTAVNR